ncbi:MAG: 2-amino-4-hydroxy-6-hydroxymethyldihydropteridine diphosphokinase [Pseudomonadales bacterium]|jgi:2-amino-4-hydroxy-6-hydroxymethyldihydropteridine diphosphokinase|nr:2-amino-4-hydroxy-6-hydroxymethyldihydropteridine diphosphokinase [Pseudomonadales bacterium]
MADLSRCAFVALGANLPSAAGTPLTTLQRAVDALRAHSAAPPVVSPYYESDPKDCPPLSPRYCNAVVALWPRADETALSLLLKLQRIEADFGRVRSSLVNAARTLDLDLLTFPNASSNTTQLTLPHPRAHERRFVLEPWIAIAGAAWPLHQRTLGQWLEACGDPPLLRVIETDGAE